MIETRPCSKRDLADADVFVRLDAERDCFTVVACPAPGPAGVCVTSADNRSRAIFEMLSLIPATKAASGRYIRSDPIRSGIRYWAGNANGYDLFGVQFFGAGLSAANDLRRPLESAGFVERTPQRKQLTFCREVRSLAASDLDAAGLRAAKTALDAALGEK